MGTLRLEVAILPHLRSSRSRALRALSGFLDRDNVGLMVKLEHSFEVLLITASGSGAVFICFLTI